MPELATKFGGMSLTNAIVYVLGPLLRFGLRTRPHRGVTHPLFHKPQNLQLKRLSHILTLRN